MSPFSYRLKMSLTGGEDTRKKDEWCAQSQDIDVASIEPI